MEKPAKAGFLIGPFEIGVQKGKVPSPCGAGGYGRLRRRVVFALLRGRRAFGPRVVVSPRRGDDYKVSVTGFAFVTPAVHADEP